VTGRVSSRVCGSGCAWSAATSLEIVVYSASKLLGIGAHGPLSARDRLLSDSQSPYVLARWVSADGSDTFQSSATPGLGEAYAATTTLTAGLFEPNWDQETLSLPLGDTDEPMYAACMRVSVTLCFAVCVPPVTHRCLYLLVGVASSLVLMMMIVLPGHPQFSHSAVGNPRRESKQQHP